jgi:hypothetical protein
MFGVMQRELCVVVLVEVEGLAAHYLEKRHICCHAIHVLCNAHALVLLIVFLQIKKK